MSNEAWSGLLEDIVVHGMLKKAADEDLVEATRLGDVGERDVAFVRDILRDIVMVNEAKTENVGKLNHPRG